MRAIKYIAVHCTAGSQLQKIDDMLLYWRKSLGWKMPGYHYVVKADGEVVQLLEEAKVSNGVSGYNSQTVNVAYMGGVDLKNGMKAVDNRTAEQKASLRVLLARLKKKYPLARIQGHRDFPNVKKDCPCFDARVEYKDL